MNLPTLRFNGEILPHNPHTLKIFYDRNVKSITVPYYGEVYNDCGIKARTVIGEGELYGDNSSEDFIRISQLQESGVEGVLSIPGIPPFTAVFKELSLTREPKSGVIGYAFKFIEKLNLTDTFSNNEPGSITTNSNTNLWELAASHNVDIETLVQRNPDIETPYTAIPPGKEVFI
ncbi:MAG: hypothetical protein ACI4II_10190 [Acutalibacteraceae bacterium]